MKNLLKRLNYIPKKELPNESEEKTSDWIGIVVAIIFIIYISDWGFLKGAVTEYPVQCPKDYHEGNGCYTLNTTTYYPKVNSQTVIKKNDYDITTYKKCSVIDRKNWQCTFDDNSGQFGFSNGRFFDTPLGTRNISDAFFSDVKYVSRWRYLLQYWLKL